MAERLYDHVSDPYLREKAQGDTDQFQARLLGQELPEQLAARNATAEQLRDLDDAELLEILLRHR